MSRRLAAVLAAALALAAAATAAAATAPTPRDRALVGQVASMVAGLRTFAGQDGAMEAQLERTLKSCPQFRKDPAGAVSAVLLLLPAIAIDVVSRYGPQLRTMSAKLGAMHPDSPLFASWLQATRQNLTLLLGFDNGGKKIDYCRAARVMAEKSPSRQELRDVFGVDPATIAKLFGSGTSQATTTLSAIAPKMRAFFVAAGLPAKTAAQLTQ